MSFQAVHVTNPKPKIEKITPLNAVALTGTNAQSFTADISKYKKIWVIAQSGCDAEIDLRFRTLLPNNSKLWNGSSWEVNDTVILPSNDTSVFHINTALPHLNNLISDSLIIRVAAKSTTTKGTVTVIVYGEVI